MHIRSDELKLAKDIAPFFKHWNLNSKQMLSIFFNFLDNSNENLNENYKLPAVRSFHILRKAIDETDIQLLKFSLEKGAIINHDVFSENSFMQRAVNSGDLKIIELLLQHGANPNSVSASQFNYCPSPLSLAVLSKEDKEIVLLLIKYGADVKAEGEQLIEKINSTMHRKIDPTFANTYAAYFMTVPSHIVEKRMEIIDILKAHL